MDIQCVDVLPCYRKVLLCYLECVTAVTVLPLIQGQCLADINLEGLQSAYLLTVFRVRLYCCRLIVSFAVGLFRLLLRW